MARKDKELRTVTIQHVAMELFSQCGYNNITMDRIASEANVTKRTLYKHFPSKLALLNSLVEKNLKELSDLIIKNTSIEGTVNDRLKAHLLSLFNFTQKNLNFMQLYWMLGTNEFNGEIPPELTNHIKMWSQSIFDASEKNIAEKELTGFFSNYSPGLIAKAISAINKGIFMQASKDENLNISSSIYQNRMLDFFLAWIDFGLTQEAPATDNFLNGLDEIK